MLSIAAVVGLAYVYFYQAGGWNQNSRFALVRAIVEQGTLRIDNSVQVDGRVTTGDLVRHDGHIYSDKAPGLALAAVLPFAVVRPFLADANSRSGTAALSYAATLAVSAVPTVLTTLLVFWLSSVLGASRGAAAFAAVVFGLATPAWCYATLFFGHALASACILTAFAAAVELRQDGSPRRHWFLALAVGLAGGWATITEFPTAIPAVIIGLLALVHVWPGGSVRRWPVIIGISLGALACLAVLGLYNAAAFGSPFSIAYTHHENFPGMKQGFLGITYPKIDVLWELLFGRFRGLLYFAPVLAFAPVGVVRLIRDPKSRRFGLALTAIVTYYLLFNASYFYWTGGWSYGPRHMAPALAFLSLSLGPLWSQARLLVRTAVAAVALYSVFGTLVAVSTTAQPPENFKNPYAEVLWPSFVSGQLSLNQQSFVQEYPTAARDPVAHAWNIGERLGLKGQASLLPLFAVWGAIGGACWIACRAKPISTQTSARGQPGPSGNRRKNRRRPGSGAA